MGDKPLAYRQGKWHFLDNDLFVNRHTLIPRFDTEILVEAVLKCGLAKHAKILDLCTGSGAIAVALAKEGYNLTASDVSKKALKVAKRNAKLHNLDINFIHSDLFQNIKILPLAKRGGTPTGEWLIDRSTPKGGGVSSKFDIIVSNPPYIKTNEIGKYDPSILYEPKLALDGGADGLDFYRRIAKEAGEYLNQGGILALEIDEPEPVVAMLEEAGFKDIKVINDLNNLPRVIVGMKVPL